MYCVRELSELDHGATILEMAIVIALVAILALAGVRRLGIETSSLYRCVGNTMYSTAIGCGVGSGPVGGGTTGGGTTGGGTTG